LGFNSTSLTTLWFDLGGENMEVALLVLTIGLFGTMALVGIISEAMKIKKLKSEEEKDKDKKDKGGE